MNNEIGKTFKDMGYSMIKAGEELEKIVKAIETLELENTKHKTFLNRLKQLITEFEN